MADERAAVAVEASPAPSRRSLLQGAAEAGLELCWLYATALFFFRVGNLPPFPPLGALLPFLAAVLPRALAGGRGWRVYQVGSLYLAALLLALLVSAHAFGRWNGNLPLTDLGWIERAIGAASSDALVFVTLLLFCLAFWWSGLAFARRPPSGEAVTRRFDLGVAFLAAVVLLGAAVHRTSPELHLLIPSFFLFSILAVALARSRGSGRRSFAAGVRGAGTLYSFALAAIILGFALLPLLRVVQDAAQRGFSALQGVVTSVWPFVLDLLAFLFGLRNTRSPAPEYSVPDQHTPQLAGHASQLGPGLFGLILTWTMIGLSGIAALVFLGYALRRLLRFLASRTPGGRVRGRGARLALLLRTLITAARALFRKALGIFRREPAQEGMGMQAFRFLTGWGRRSGAGRLARETPLQYGRRLGLRFPELAASIAHIVESFDEELYGESALPPERQSVLRRSCRELARPGFWLRRARSLAAPSASPARQAPSASAPLSRQQRPAPVEAPSAEPDRPGAQD